MEHRACSQRHLVATPGAFTTLPFTKCERSLMATTRASKTLGPSTCFKILPACLLVCELSLELPKACRERRARHRRMLLMVVSLIKRISWRHLSVPIHLPDRVQRNRIQDPSARWVPSGNILATYEELSTSTWISVDCIRNLEHQTRASQKRPTRVLIHAANSCANDILRCEPVNLELGAPR